MTKLSIAENYPMSWAYNSFGTSAVPKRNLKNFLEFNFFLKFVLKTRLFFKIVFLL